MIPKEFKTPFYRIQELFYENIASQIIKKNKYSIAKNYKRIYHYHIRKTAGTSLNSAFWSLAGLDMQRMGRKLYAFNEKYVFVFNKQSAIEYGNYFYASSHTPSHKLNLPKETFTITILRSPTDRLISYYRYMLFIRNEHRARYEDPFWKETYPEAKNVLGNSFHDFLDNISPSTLNAQIFMFSESLDVEEAVENALKCSSILFTESFNTDLENLSRKLDLPLIFKKERQFNVKANINLSESEIERLQRLLEKENVFFNQIKSMAI